MKQIRSVSYLLCKSWKMRHKSLTKGFSRKYNFSSSFLLYTRSFVMIFPQECDLYVHISFLYSRRNKEKKQYSESGEKKFLFLMLIKDMEEGAKTRDWLFVSWRPAAVLSICFQSFPHKLLFNLPSFIAMSRRKLNNIFLYKLHRDKTQIITKVMWKI